MKGTSTATPTRRPFADFTLTLAILATVGVMLVPLPTPALDLLLASNLGLAILIVMVAVYVPGGLGFTVFPTLLLLTTLYRLALNVSSTRLILVQADAGRVIDAFGHFVVMGSLAVGAVVFIVLTLIQFVVITRGAERVAEVGARFTLDAMPGKQLSIDAERRTGAISAAEAARRRQLLETESQFYGAMDGAMKFVKGDAIAGLAITGLNFAAGTSVGVIRDSLPIGEALHTYGLLTIGDGLVSQVPALLISISAGLVVTRVATQLESPSLANAIATQLFAQPRAMFAAAAFLVVIGLIPGLPALPFSMLALGLAVVGWRLLRTETRRREAAAGDTSGRPPRLALELSPEDHRALDLKTSPLSEVFRTVSDDLARTLGVALPPPNSQADADLSPGSFRLRIQGVPSALVHVEPGAELLPAIQRSLQAITKRRAAELLSVQDVQARLDDASDDEPALVTAAVGAVPNVVTITQVLRRLLGEGVSVRPLDRILEALAGHGGADLGPDELLIHIRRALGSYLVLPHLGPEGALRHLTLSPHVEDELRSRSRVPGGLTLAPGLYKELLAQLREAHSAHPAAALLVESEVRPRFRRLISAELPDLSVLAWDEIPGDTPIIREQEVCA